MLQPIALPAAEISAAWDSRRGRMIVHPSGLNEAAPRPEWDAARRRLDQLVADAPPIVQEQPGRLARLLQRLLERRA